MKLTITANTESFSKKLKAKRDEIVKNMRNVVRQYGLEVHKRARGKCPVVTTNLRDSISVEFIIDPPNWAAKIYTNVEYASYVEYDERADHSVGARQRWVSGQMQNLQQSNANATWGFMRKSLAEVAPNFKQAVAEVMR